MLRASTLILVLIVAGVAARLPAAASVAPPFTQQSWVDTLHGWATDGSIVYAKENGGRSWRLALRTGSYAVQTNRTSVGSGFVSS
jgi:hypothetical protein